MTKELDYISNRVDSITDSLGKNIDPKIKKAVIAFNYAGFVTSQSCEGHLDKWGTPYPWVEVESTDSIGMESLLDRFYANCDYTDSSLRIVAMSDSRYRVQSDPILANADLVPLYERDPKRLTLCQEEMDKFADFLMKWVNDGRQ